jgi:hypothetical protein
LIGQVNVCYKNIYGKAIYRKNGIIHIRFINIKSPRKNKKYSGATLDLIKTVDTKYEIVHSSLIEDDLYMIEEFDDFSDFKKRKATHFHFGLEGLILSLDELRKTFQSLNYNKNQEDFRENVEKFIKRAEKKEFILKHTWKYAEQNDSDFYQKYNDLERGKLPEYCFIQRPKHCYVLSCATDSKIHIRTLSPEKFDKIENDPTENIGHDIISAKIIVNMPPDWVPNLLKQLIPYYPWGCTVSQLFHAIKYWEQNQ